MSQNSKQNVCNLLRIANSESSENVSASSNTESDERFNTKMSDYIVDLIC